MILQRNFPEMLVIVQFIIDSIFKNDSYCLSITVIDIPINISIKVVSPEKSQSSEANRLMKICIGFITELLTYKTVFTL